MVSPELPRCKVAAGSRGRAVVSVHASGNSNTDIEHAWASSGFSPVERSRLEEDYVWNHTTDIIYDKGVKKYQVKMELVERAVHDKAAGGFAHTGGFAAVEWLIENRIDR